MSATLKTQMQLARINRTKLRTHAWWHSTHCEACRMQRMATADLGAAVSALVKRAHDAVGDSFALPPVGEMPKH